MKVLVTGASGLLGRAVVEEFQQAGHEVVGTAFSRATKHRFIKLDLTDLESVQRVIQEQKPNVLVHCAAERRPDVAEKDHEGTRKLNVAVPKHLATICKDASVFFIYISTDYVFDGTQPPYDVHDKPNPLNFYGKSKLEGEDAVRSVYPDAVALRVPVLYGKTEYNGESAVNVLLDAVKNANKDVNMDNVANRYPTNVNDVARIIKDLAALRVEKGNKDVTGTFHFSNTEMYTKYTMCQMMAKILNVNIDHIKPQNEVPNSAATSRPKDSHLSNRRLENLGIDTKNVSFEQWWMDYLKIQS